MEDLLPGVAAVIDRDGVATLCYAEFLGDGARHLEETLDNSVGQGADLLQVRDVLPGDDENVDRGLAIHVLEGKHIILVVDYLSVYFPSSYFTEYAVGLAHSHLL